MRALQKSPNDRYPTAQHMATDLERFLHKHSPIFTTGTVSEWTQKVLGDVPSIVLDEDLPERDGKAATRGFTREQLLHPGDDFSDENPLGAS